jgi:nucleotide-binding universal stress UspA family protein
MLKNIVVPLDSSSYSWSAAQHAVKMACPYRAAIHGLYVVDAKITEGQLLSDLNVDPEEAHDLYQAKGHNLLGKFEKECKGANVEFHPVIAEGVVSRVIRDTATEFNAELIIMGKKGVNAQWSGPLLGSVAEIVVRQAKRPVLLAQENYSPIEAAYVAYDGELVSIRALRFAAELCARCKWRMYAISVHRSEERQKELLQQAVEMAELHGLKITTVGGSGDTTEEILAAVSEDPNTLIVLGAYSSRLRRLILGSVPEQVMRQARQPILIYRPQP